MKNDLLIENATIVTMNDERDILTGASLAISGDRIAALGDATALRAQYPGAETLDGRGKVVLPGLINCHTHISMSLQKGVTLAVKDGLYRVMWPVEKSLTAEDCYYGALFGGAEALKSGTTCVVDHYFHMEGIARATTELGLRGGPSSSGHYVHAVQMIDVATASSRSERPAGVSVRQRWGGAKW